MSRNRLKSVTETLPHEEHKFLEQFATGMLTQDGENSSVDEVNH